MVKSVSALTQCLRLLKLLKEFIVAFHFSQEIFYSGCILGIFFQDGYKRLKDTPFQYYNFEEVLVFYIFMICLMKNNIGQNMQYVYIFFVSEQRLSKLPRELASYLALFLSALRAGQLRKICHGNFVTLKFLIQYRIQKHFSLTWNCLDLGFMAELWS